MKVLIVEDEIDVADLLQIFISLDFPEAEITIASNGEDALEKINILRSVDFIFSDFNMPKKNGGDLFLEVRKILPTTPFILVTSEDPKKHKQFAGASHFYHIDKPFSDKDVNGRIIQIQSGIKVSPSKSRDYIPIGIETLKRLYKIGTAVYLKISSEKYVKVLHPGTEFNDAEVKRFSDKSIHELYIEKIEFENFIKEFRKTVFSRLAWEKVKQEEKIDILADDIALIGKAARIFGWSPAVVSLAQENISNVINLLKTEPTFSRITDMLKHDKNKKLASHSILLTIMLTEVATRMNWASQGTIEKLTFAAILHDIELDDDLFADKQTLLMAGEIMTLKETAEGNKLLSHPLDGAQLTLNWPMCPSDVDIIIRQHHERPDGRGFPLGLAPFKISPLSAAFIMCEDVIYKSMIDPDCNLKNYFVGQKEYYSREPFKSIYPKLLEIFL
ncbi:MAG: response regulator [Bdellovibrionaceae bacterium]|nr:response regulator [Pseudobdellovibrionaceae bacterium]